MDHKTDRPGAHNIIALSPLPEPDFTSYQTDSTMRSMELRSFSDNQMREYARQEVYRAEEAWQARASLAASAGREPVAAPPMDGEIALIEKAVQRAGITSLLNHGAASCVYTEGCAGVSQEHLLAYTREIALHCAVALGAGPSSSDTPPADEKPVAWAIFAPNGNIRMWSVKPDEVARAAAGFGQEPTPLYTHPSPPEGAGWISVDERLPEVSVTVLVYEPFRHGEDWPGTVRISYDHICPDYEGWHDHCASYEHFMAVGGANACGPDVTCTGPSEKAPYTHWMPIPAPPASEAKERGNG